ncbi:MAG TPA: hypothetical protein VGM02_01655 [Acidobacteriaceae bacterium]|jgi:hypothetical protein
MTKRKQRPTTTHDEVRLKLDAIRSKTGQPFLIDREVWETIQAHLQSRGEIFRVSGIPHYYDRADRRVIRLGADNPWFTRFLIDLGLLPTERHTQLVSTMLCNAGLLSFNSLREGDTYQDDSRRDDLRPGDAESYLKDCPSFWPFATPRWMMIDGGHEPNRV